MKKRNTRSTLLVLLVCASISSAIYLNMLSSEDNATTLPAIEMSGQEEFDLEENSTKPLPDVHLLKRILRVKDWALSARLEK